MSRFGIILLLAVLLLAGVVLADEGYERSWHTVDGGGATFSIGGGYSLGGTIGQPDAGLLTGGGYSLGGGFWGGGALTPQRHEVYLPLVVRNVP